MTREPWHHFPSDEISRILDVDFTVGLSDAEVAARRLKHGPNVLSARRGPGAFRRFLQQFQQPLVYILIFATAVTLFLREWVDSAVIFAVVVINAIVGFIQESKAEKSISALSRLVVTETSVRRNGRRVRVPSEDLVPGDIVLLQSGDRVPADLRLFNVRSLQADESMLTGESVPVEKHADSLSMDTILAERRNQAFAGTMATYGQAEGVVWSTGDRTEMGHIASLLSDAADLSTPLTRKIAHFSSRLLWAILALAAVAFGVGILQGHTAVDMFMAAVALSVGAIPEGLPAAVTITLAIGVSRMARRRAIIRKLPAVETLGSTTVICSDKTGTLTENRMTVQRVWAGGRRYDVTGNGYEAVGDISHDGRPASASEHPALMECLTAGLLCNDSQFVSKNDRMELDGDPTEAALIVSARKSGLSGPDLRAARPRLDSIPFESVHQYMATLHGSANGDPGVIYKKGAFEKLLDRCSHQLGCDGSREPIDRAGATRAVEEMAAAGLRVLAFARREVRADLRKIAHDDVSQDLTFLGLQGMIDPPRVEAIEAVRRCRQAGIRIKMITGDHVLTAAAVARQIGLVAEGDDSRALTGRELEQLSDDDFTDVAERVSVFARVAPEQKLRLVRALQARGHIVAMTGDGVNDAPALKQADIGVAMGITGTDVAKGAADMILTDDNFASIEAAVEEGRAVFDNLTKFIVWTLPTNAGEAAILLTAILTGMALPILPVQILWVNMTTALFLGLMLVFEPMEKGLMARPPRDPREPIVTRVLLRRTAFVTLLMLAAAYVMFHWQQEEDGSGLAEARTLVVNVIVFVEAFYLLNCRSLTRSMFSVGLFSNPALLGGISLTVLIQMAFTYVPFMNRWFQSAPLDAGAWGWVLGAGAVVYVAVEVEKWIRSRRN